MLMTHTPAPTQNKIQNKKDKPLLHFCQQRTQRRHFAAFHPINKESYQQNKKS